MTILDLLKNFDPEDEYTDNPATVDLDDSGRWTIIYDGDITIIDHGPVNSEPDSVFIPRCLIPDLLQAIVNCANETAT